MVHSKMHRDRWFLIPDISPVLIMHNLDDELGVQELGT